MKRFDVYRKKEWGPGLIWVKTFYESGYRKGNSYTSATGAKRAAKRFIEKQKQEKPKSQWILLEETY